MTETRCDCCDLPDYSCGRQAEQRARAEEAEAHLDALSTREAFVASYPGTCGACGDWFAAGTPIRRFYGGYRNLMCCPVAS